MARRGSCPRSKDSMGSVHRVKGQWGGRGAVSSRAQGLGVQGNLNSGGPEGTAPGGAGLEGWVGARLGWGARGVRRLGVPGGSQRWAGDTWECGGGGAGPSAGALV